VGGGGGGAPSSRFVDSGDDGSHQHIFAVGGEELRDDAAYRRGDIGGDLVSLQLEQSLVDGDSFSNLDVPSADGAFRDGLTYLGNDDVGHDSRSFSPCGGVSLDGAILDVAICSGLPADGPAS
jgi:hypothetical protein